MLHLVGLSAGLALSGQAGPVSPARPLAAPAQAPTAAVAVNPAALLAQIKSFTLDGFVFERLEFEAGASPEKMSGSAWLALPAPLEGRKVAFRDLAHAGGGQAKGTVLFAGGGARDAQGWHWNLGQVRLSDQGSQLAGTASVGGLQVDLALLAFTPKGLLGTLELGELVLAKGDFSAVLTRAELAFGPEPPTLGGDLACTLDRSFRRHDDGEAVRLERKAVRFPGSLLAGTGAVAEHLGDGLAAAQAGNTWLLDDLALGFERGTPVLAGQMRLQFPLEAFFQEGDSGQPYRSGSARGTVRGEGPGPQLIAGHPGAARPAQAALEAAPAQPRVLKIPAQVQGAKSSPAMTATQAHLPAGVAQTAPAGAVPAALPRGFTASFPLPAAKLVPGGLTSYRLEVANGTLAVQEGRFLAEGTRLTGAVRWGDDWKAEVRIKDAAVDLSDGLYLSVGHFQGAVRVGAYLVQGSLAGAVVDFSSGRSPSNLAAGWQGIYLPAFLLSLPEELYHFYGPGSPQAGHRARVVVAAKDGRFGADGGFEAAVAVHLDGLVNLHVVPVRLDPFELHFVDGAVLSAPKVTGHTELVADPLLPAPGLQLPLSFQLTQGGAQHIALVAATAKGPTRLDTDLVGVDIVLEAAVLHPTNLDFTGRFDFNAKGAELPSVAFDHLVLEATGGGIEDDYGPMQLAVVGNLWQEVNGHPKVKLWGYDFGIQESGFGTLADKRFFVGFGGDFDVNPVLPTLYNRALWTTEKDHPKEGTVEMEKSFDFNRRLGDLASLDGHMDFTVDVADDQVSEAYFLGRGSLAMELGDTKVGVDAGLRFGRKWTAADSFPYFFALGHFTMPAAGIEVAPDVEIFGGLGGVAQNFLPDTIREVEAIKGTADPSLGMAIMAGVDVGSSDQYAFHGGLDLYVGQDLTTLLQGTAYLFCGRKDEPSDRKVLADVRFTRKPNVFNATFDADISQYGGLVRYVGEVVMRFSAEGSFLHIGTREAPIDVHTGFASGTGFVGVDWAPGKVSVAGGYGWGMDTGDRSFGIVYGRAWLNAAGDFVIILGPEMSTSGLLQASGGAEFGMRFKTFWHTYHLQIFGGDFAAAMAMQMPGHPTLSGNLSIHYSVLGGAFSGSVGVNLEFN
jgi:hypothetical protein